MLERENNEKVFFLPGDLVTIKHDLPNKRIMLVKGKAQSLIKRDDGSHLKGIRCIWFTDIGELQESIFSTKDLERVL